MDYQDTYNYRLTRKAIFVLFVFTTTAITFFLGGCKPKSKTWEEKISNIVWVAYSPPSSDPNQGIEASSNSIQDDLAMLRQAGFTGIVTYSSSGILGHKLPTLAQEQGFQGIIMGIWDPANQDEIAIAKDASNNPVVLGFCVGNEGLQKRYQMSVLSMAIQELKTTGKPVTTTEEIDDYSDESLLQIGDWVFPNAHPYFHSQFDPETAVRWTKAAYADMKRRAKRFVMFKEVGLPTAGDTEGKLSEENQAQYYQELAKTDICFVYFEAFDQPWKTHLPIEPHWGIFRSDRTPKLLGAKLMKNAPSLPEPSPKTAFYIYRDADSPDNHYKPTGYMGDAGDIYINEAYEETSQSGKTSIRVVYTAKGKGPNLCSYSPPCKWAGVYWQEPPNNWGKDAFWKGRGFDLSHYNRLVFWAKAEKKCAIEFKVGGIIGTYGDSLGYPRGIKAVLNQEWKEFEIDLSGADLTHIIGGFVWVSNWETNPNGITFYLDDIRFEKLKKRWGTAILGFMRDRLGALRYTDTGSELADLMIVFSSILLLLIIIIAAFFDVVRFNRDGNFFVFAPFIGFMGGAIIRGVIWHWAWWIVRWEEASIFNDFILGTLQFMIPGGICGLIAGYIVVFVCYYPFKLLAWSLGILNKHCGTRP